MAANKREIRWYKKSSRMKKPRGKKRMPLSAESMALIENNAAAYRSKFKLPDEEKQ